MAPLIVQQMGPHKAYWELFCGSMAVLLAKPACSFEVVNDLHGDLINLGWVLQHARHGPSLYRRLRRTLFSEALFAVCKDALDYHAVAREPHDLDTGRAWDHIERAYCYFVLCWMGRSGVLGTRGGNNNFTIRYTSSGGNQATRFHAAVTSIPAWRARLRSATILRRDGLDLLERIPDERGTAIYVDPPYLQKGAAYEHDFDAADHGRLASLLQRFQAARVVVSYYAHERLADLYPASRWSTLDCSRTKHLSVQGRRGAEAKTAPEVLLVNGPPFLAGGGAEMFAETEALL